MGPPPFPPGYILPPITTPETPWFWRGNLSSIPPPAGVIPNFENPVNLHVYNKITQGICLPVATILVGIRIYTKCHLLRNPGWEDWTTILGWLGLILYSTVNLLEDKHGSGVHLWDVTGDEFVSYLKLTWINEIAYSPIMFFIKLSILLLYLRVFQPIKGTFIALHVILWSNMILYTIGPFIEIFQCDPIRKKWWPLWPGRCMNQRAIQISSSSINMASDLAILLLPIMSVWNLNITQKRKYGLFAVFGFGVLACIFSTARLIYSIKHSWSGLYYDTTWQLYRVSLLTTAELTCGLVCGSLPILPAFFRHMPRLNISITFTNRSFSTRSNGYYKNSSSRGGKHSKTPSGIVLASASSDPATRKQPPPRKEAWEELDDLEYKGGVEYNKSPDPFSAQEQGFANDWQRDPQDFGSKDGSHIGVAVVR